MFGRASALNSSASIRLPVFPGLVRSVGSGRRILANESPEKYRRLIRLAQFAAVFCCRCEFALSARGSFSGVLDQMRFFRPCGAYTDLGHVSPAINRWAIFLRPRGTRLRT